MKIDWTGKQRRERNAAAGAPDGPKRKRGCLGCLGIIVVIIVIAAIASAVGGGSNNDDEKKSGDKRHRPHRRKLPRNGWSPSSRQLRNPSQKSQLPMTPRRP